MRVTRTLSVPMLCPRNLLILAMPLVSSNLTCCYCHLFQECTKLERPERDPWPAERKYHAATCLNYGDHYPQLLVTGGVDKNNKTLSDAWVLDINSGKWREVREVEWCGV